LPEGVECIRIDRGGDVTWHGPGQLTLYPIVDLKLLRLGVKEYGSLREQAVIDTLEHYGIKGERVEGATGVWLETGTPRERKICAIGVKVSHGVTMHGLALNVSNSIAPFAAIHPCGFTDKGVTTIVLELPDTQAVPDVAEVAARIAPRLETLLTQKQ
ncbi:MAG: lipoyl(octanoyl) transferase LipB, partial [Muribaculaceae bacterium]|nr:lipoyl(octanoyl) transferase LipB [Muribaculaceae bacterium]